MADSYDITVQGHLNAGWSRWFDGMEIRNVADGTAVLSGRLADQAALYGVLLKINDLGLSLVAVQRLGRQEADT